MGVPAVNLPCAIANGITAKLLTSITPDSRVFGFHPERTQRKRNPQSFGKGVIQADRTTADVVRIENGRPRYGVDITDSSMPQETQQMHAVHPSKGCYIGQEIVERVRSRGHVNRLLVRTRNRRIRCAQSRRKDRGGRKRGRHDHLGGLFTCTRQGGGDRHRDETKP